MTGQANRGMTFEALIEQANRRYRLDGLAVIEKQHTLCKPLRGGDGRIHGAKYEEKATVDFMGRYGGRPIAFEAKHCSADRIDLKRVEEHQCDFLRDWTAQQGAIGFVIISFGLDGFYLVPWAYWSAARTARGLGCGMDVFDPGIGTVWRATGKASIKREELPHDWEIPTGGTAWLDYLAVVKRLWGAQEERREEG